MSFDSFAALRRHSGNELADLAQEHFKHDLTETDRQRLQSAATTITTSATIGSLLGLTLGALLALRLRRSRAQMFRAMRARERPTHVQFADGRTEALPDLTPLMKPSRVGDVATYMFFGAGGVFVFGEGGALIGAQRAKGVISGDEESRRRIEVAFRRFRADVLRREVVELEKGTGTGGLDEMAGGLLK